MSEPVFSFTSRARPIVEIGIGNAQVPTGQALWDVALWDAPTSTWAGDEPTWRDVSCFAQYADGELGRGRVTDPFPDGELSIAFDNSTGWADPVMVDVDGVLSVRPGRVIRIGVDHVEFGVRWLFRGFIDGVEPLFDPEMPDSVMFRCIDALGEAGRAKLAQFVTTGADEFAHERIARILDAVPWLDSKRDLDSSSVEMVGAVLSGQVIDMLRRTADSAGGAVFGDGNGNVAFRNKDWLYVTTDTPLDGTIGNGSTTVTTVGYAGFPETSGSGLSGATSGSPIAVSPLTVAARIRPQTLLGVQTIAAHVGAGGFQLALSNDQLRFLWWVNGVSYAWRYSGSIAGAPVDPDGWLWVGVEFNAAGAAAFYISPDAETWTRITLATFTATTLEDEAGDLWLGSLNGLAPFNGDIARVYVRNSANGSMTGGTVVFDFDGTADIVNPAATSITTTSGHTLDVENGSNPVTLVESVSADVPDTCPSGWRTPFVRADLTTQVILDRLMPPETVTLPEPRIYTDVAGRRQYGVEPLEMRDLWTRDDGDMDELGNRILAQRNAVTLPLVQSVSIDAATSDRAVDLLTLLDIWRPNRYRCRHTTANGTVFDDNYFATGVSFHIDRDLWTAEISLDKSALYEIPTASRWDDARWDRARWSA